MADKPNWKIPADYPNLGNTSMKRWAWEFLRRNPEYKLDYADYLHVVDSIIPGFNPLHPPHSTSEEINRIYSALESDERYWVYDPPKQSGETEEAWRRRTGKGTVTPLAQWHARKWGLQSDLFDPYDEYNSHYVHFEIGAGMVSTAGPGWGGFNDTYPKTREACIIDFDLPLDLQLADIKAWATRRYKSLVVAGAVTQWKEKRKQDYRLYVRILDALEELGDAPNEKQVKFIGKNFYSKKSNVYPDFMQDKNARAAIRAAKILRDKIYRYLPLKATPGTVKK